MEDINLLLREALVVGDESYPQYDFLVGSWLFRNQYLCLESLRFMLGGSLEIGVRSILFWLPEGQTHFGML